MILVFAEVISSGDPRDRNLG